VWGTADSLGLFSVRLPQADTVELEVSLLNHVPYKRLLSPSEGQNLGDIVLKQERDILDAAVVSASFIKRRGGNYTLSLKDNPLAKGKNTLQVLNSLPGIRGLRIYGSKTPATLYVNGREMKLPPETLYKYIASLRADDVSTIQILPTGGVGMSMDKKGGVIKLRLRSGEDRRLSGSVTLPVSVNAETGTLSTNVPATLNYVTPKFSTYSFAYLYWLQEERTDEGFDISGKVENSENRRSFFSAHYDQSALYEFDGDHSLGGAVTLSGKPHERDKYLNLQSGAPVSNSMNDISSYGLGASLIYNQTFDDRGSNMKLSADYFAKKDKLDEDYSTMISGDESSTVSSTNKNSFSGKADFSWVLPDEDSEFDFGVSYSQMGGRQRYEQFGERGGRFDYDENIFAAYAEFSTSLFDYTLDVDAGVRYEHAYIQSRDKFDNILPTLSLTYNFSDDESYLTFDLDHDLSRPTMWDYDPVAYHMGEDVYYTGGENLTTQLEHSISLTQSLKGNHLFMLSYIWNNDVMDDIYTEDDGKIYNRESRIGSQKNLEFYADTRFWLVNKKLSARLSFTGDYLKFDGETFGSFESVNALIESGIYWYLPKSWTVGVAGVFRTPEETVVAKYNGNWSVDFSVNKKINDHWAISLSSFRLLSSSHTVVTSKNIDFKCDGRNYFKTVTLSLTYRFGSQWPSKASGVRTNRELQSRSAGK